MALVNPIVETGLILSWNWNNKYGIVQVQPRPQPGDQITCKPPDKRSFYTGVVLSTNADGSYDVEFAAEGEYENEVCKNVKEVEEELDHHANAKELLVHHANCEPKAHGALGFGDETICAGEVWFEPLERIYFNRDSRQPGIAINVTMYPHTNAIVDMDDELDANQKQRSSYVSDSTDDEDVKPRVREVITPNKNMPKTPKKITFVPKKPAKPSPHVGIPPSPGDKINKI